jgi:drug/metabolite transporter (DMT)-like permease
MPSNALASLLIGLLCFIWGSTWFVIRIGLRDLPPFQSAAVRFMVAAALMTLVAHFVQKREGGQKPARWLVLTIGSLNFGASYACVYFGETLMPSAFASVLWSAFPLLMALAGHFYLPGEHLVARQWLGFVLGFAGVVLLFATDLVGLGPDALLGGIVLLGSPLSAMIGTTLLKKYGSGASSLLVNRDGMWIGACLLASCALLFERGAPAHWSGSAIATVAYLAVVGTAVAFGLYFWLLRHTSAYRMSLIAYGTPPIAVLCGALVLDEPITGWTIGGMAAILGGVLLVMRGKRPVAQKPAS